MITIAPYFLQQLYAACCIFAAQMQRRSYINAQKRYRFYSLVMVLLLAWLTVSTPFVYESQQQVAAAQGLTDSSKASDPFSNTTEEKVETGVNTLSEYLHEIHHPLPPVSTAAIVYKCHPDDLYFAFHPELLSPPPESSL